jgi:hypothetical protein
MLTLFSIPKPFRGNIAIIQRNAIQSWTLLHPACEIVLFGDEEGTAETAAKLGVRHVPQVERNQYGTPLLHSLFAKAQAMATNSLLCYINTDIILTSDFLPAIQSVRKMRRFLLVGQRWDVNLDKPWDFDKSDWEVLLRSYVRKNGKLHAAASDYFVFPKGLWGHIPPFAVGRTSYDNWFIYRARLLKVPIVDTTRMVFCIHQNHERTYNSVSLKAPNGIEGLRKGVEAKRNLELAGGYRHIFTLKDATHILTPSGQKLDLSLSRLSRHLDTLPILFPHLRFVVMLVMMLIRISRPLRLALRLIANSTRHER